MQASFSTSGEVIQFNINMMYLETNFFLYASTGKGIDSIAPDLVQGPLPIGLKIANLDHVTSQIIKEFGLEEVGMIRAILKTKLVGPIQMPLVNLSVEAWDDFVRLAFNVSVSAPTFNTYANTINFLPTGAAITPLL
ncbi:hypothetical protein COLO4_29842 [Corchorus olitorius]|uniref:Uncharacterized protein n=1 Tax=Corchorus olitorius TaxID=93759 RepID=A0A1R3HD36_9ROSI|nr:hypothetical protein COLO4_29842 [Corchorus olitorius]